MYGQVQRLVLIHRFEGSFHAHRLPFLTSWRLLLSDKLLVFLWLDTPFFVLYWPLIPVILALIPLIVGAMVGAWTRSGSKRPWLRARGCGVLIWWVLLLIALFAFFLWLAAVISQPVPGAEVGSDFHQPGYGYGLLAGFVLLYSGAYAVAGLPFILPGAVLTFPRPGVV